MEPDPGNYFNSIILLDQVTIWPDVIGQFVFFIILIMISFLVSGSEVAFFSLSKAEIDEYREDLSADSQRVWKLISFPKKLLATILITNNFVNVAAILVGSNIIKTFGEVYDWNSGIPLWGDWEISIEILLNIVLITSILLFFGEIVPKVYASRNRKKIIQFVALPMDMLRAFFYPLSFILIEGTRFIDKKIKLKETNASLDDLRHAINLTATDEDHKDDQEILKGIVNFKNITVKSVMRARVDVVAIDINIPLEELVTLINDETYSRLPVYEENLDNVKGILHIKDLLPYVRPGLEAPEPDLRKLLRDVYFVPENKKIDSLLEEFKSQRIHIAVVVDEFGGTAGIVTLEDVIEEIFGEINDEFDSDDWIYTKKSDDTYIFEGRISLIDVKKIVGLDEDVFEDARGDSDSLGGLILELHGKIPEIGDIIEYKNFELHVESVSKNRINMIKFVIKEAAEEEK